ncbi:MAG TPA: YraN family protein [Planctomycetes bacterium]|nr:YraN family protein [Planctomycetota bacterium]
MTWLRALTGRLRPPVDKDDLGHRGEKAAARFLRRRGYRIIARGYQSGVGEIDLVAEQGGTVVFVEVKTRHADQPGSPVEAVDEEKQRRLSRAAVAFLKRYGLLEYPARFDVVAVTWHNDRQRPVIEHFPDAFDAAGEGGLYS